MAQMISTVLGALLVTGLYYLMTDVLEKKGSWNLPRKNGWLWSGRVLLMGLLAFAACIVMGLRGTLYTQPVEMIQTMILVWGMACLAVSDLHSRRIPNRFLILLFLLWAGTTGLYVILDIESGMALLFRAAAGGLTGGLIFLLCYLLSRKQLGAGDVKLAAVMGLYLTGQRIIGAIFYGVLLCCVYCIIQLCRKKLGLRDGVPLVPFLYVGVLITLLIL